MVQLWCLFFFFLQMPVAFSIFSSFKKKFFLLVFCLFFFLPLLIPVIKVLALNFGSHSEVLEVYHNVPEPSL